MSGNDGHASDVVRTDGRLKAVLIAAIVVGAAAFLAAVLLGKGTTPLRAWQALLINWLFFTGVAQGGVVVAAILEVTDSRWGRPLKRLAESFGIFLPVSFLMFLALIPGMSRLYPWVDSPVPGLETWLSSGFVVARDIAAMIVLYGLSLLFVYHSVRPDLGPDPMDGSPSAGLRAWLKRGWRGDAEEVTRAGNIRRALAPALIIIFGAVCSLIAYDLVMSLAPTWYSTLFGAYMAIVDVFAALAMTAALAVIMKKALRLEGALSEPQYHDLGKLMFGFCLLTMDFFWSQFLVLWYGNIPEETDYIMVRAFGHPWMAVTWLVLFGGFLAPFFLLLRRRMKAEPGRLAAISVWIVLMMWLERFVLVAPSAWTGTALPLGPLELLITLGCAGMFLLAIIWFMARVPSLPVSDPALEGQVHHHVLGEPDAA